MYPLLEENYVKILKQEHEAASDEKTKKILREMAPYTAEVLNPFKLRRELSYLQILKVALLSVILLPIRAMLMLIILVIAWILAVITLYGLPEDQEKGLEPITGWRRRYAKPVVASLARFMFVVVGWHWIPHKGMRASVQEAPILLVAPHSSFWDTVVVIALGCPGMVSTDAVRATPLFGTLVRFMQPLYLRSGDSNSRRRIGQDIFDRVTSGKDFEQLLIFPEGGCANRKALLNFKLGAFKPGVSVQPVFIRYKNKLDTITWAWDGPEGWKQLWLTFTQFHIVCEIEFLPVYRPSESERKNARLFADNVQNYMARWTETPITKFSLDDAKFFQTAKQLNLPPTAALIKFLRLRKTIGRQDLNPKLELLQLKKGAETTKGNAEALATYLNLEKCPEILNDFCLLMDQSKKGYIDFRLYSAALCLIRNDLTTKGKLDAVFQELGTKNDAELLAAIFLLWKGVPSSVATLQNFTIID